MTACKVNIYENFAMMKRRVTVTLDGEVIDVVGVPKVEMTVGDKVKVTMDVLVDFLAVETQEMSAEEAAAP